MTKTIDAPMKPYVDAGEQLVAEFYVRDLAPAREFLCALGFAVVRSEPDFLVMRWEQSLIFLERVDRYAPPPATPVVNIRVMVPDVDDYWRKALAPGARVIRPIGDRYYDLRDFTIAGPDGIALRFATPISAR
jgi:catechol 2,3-dioxygenase-like lactoylglutathione lyase family enzyme